MSLSRFRAPLILSALILFVGVFAGGKLGLYAAIPYFDKVMHFSGGIAAAWLAWVFLRDDIAPLQKWKQALIVVSVAALISVFWEFAEYASNFTEHAFPWFYRYLHSGNLADTITDLVCDLAGAFVFSAWALRKRA
jgi:uncharacterized membrane protein YjdF